MPIHIIHGVRLTESAQRGAEVTGACLYQNGVAFGPVFDTLEDLEDFVRWCDEHHARGVILEIVMDQHAAWLHDRKAVMA